MYIDVFTELDLLMYESGRTVQSVWLDKEKFLQWPG